MTKTPVALYQFGVEIKGIVAGLFTECNGLNAEREIFEVKEGGINNFVHKLPGRIKYSNITLKRGFIDDALWKWFEKGLYNGQVEKHNLSILLFSTDRQSSTRWNLVDAYPVKWQGPDFKTDSNQIAVESLELAHHGLELMG